MAFKKATKQNARLRIALEGPAGSGKTYTALALATSLGNRVALIDTERRTSELYAHLFVFDVDQLDSFHPSNYTRAIEEAGRLGYDVLVIDSLSHAWEGKDGALELVDKKGGNGNKFAGWKDVTPLMHRLVDSILQSPCHVIATMRTKTEWVMEEQTNRQGRKVQVPVKVGLAPIMRQGIDYEFSVIGTIDSEHNLSITKTRIDVLDGKQFYKPGKDLADLMLNWLNTSTAYTPQEAPVVAQGHTPTGNQEQAPSQPSQVPQNGSPKPAIDPRLVKMVLDRFYYANTQLREHYLHLMTDEAIAEAIIKDIKEQFEVKSAAELMAVKPEDLCMELFEGVTVSVGDDPADALAEG